jgi:tetratricopeptide (TPR) repeat protein
VAVAGLALAVLPVTLHNAWRGHDLVLVSSNLGVNFHLGNNPRADGRIAASDALPANPQAAERAARDQAESAAGHALRASQVSGYWLRRGLDWDLEHPGRALGLAVRKFFFAWNAAEISDNEDLSGLAHHLWVFRILPVGSWLLAPAGLVGLLWVPRRRDRDLGRWFVGAQIASLLPFFIVSRFRLPWMPVLAVFAAWTLVTLFQMIRHPQQRSLRLGLASAAAALFCSLPAFGVRAPVEFDLDYKLGYAWQQKGRPQEALAAYRDAVRRHPDNALACNALGVLLADQGGDLDEAAAWIEKALQLDRSRTANYQESLAGVRLKQGDAQRALAACDAGLAADPDPATRAALQRRREAALRLQGEARAPGSGSNPR